MKRIRTHVFSSVSFFVLMLGAAVNTYANVIGQPGLEHATSAAVSQPGFYESGGVTYVNTSNLLGGDNTFQSLSSHLDLGYFSLVRGLDLGISLYQSTFVLNKTTYHDNGDVWLTVKYGYDLNKWFSAGALVQPRFLSSADGLGFNTSATSYLGLLLFTFNLTGISRFTPLLVHVNLGYYGDNSSNLLGNPYSYNVTGLYGLGIRGDNRFIGDLGLEGVFLNNLLHPFIELSTEQASGYKYYKASLASLGSPSFLQNPFYITPGIKIILPNRLYLLAAGDIGMPQKLSDVTATTSYPYAPWDLYVEIGYQIIPCKTPVEKACPMEKAAATTEAPAPAPVHQAPVKKQTPPAVPVQAPPPATPKPASVYKTRLKNAYINKLGMKIEITHAIHFRLGSAVILHGSYAILDDVVTLLKYNPDIHVRVEGYTDNIGSPVYNKNLSKKRAQSVMDYLARHGIAADRLTAAGYGEESPIASNSTAAGRARNRRVEFKIIKGQ